MKGINIYGEVIIFKERYGYQTTISHKDVNDKWENMRIDVTFKGGAELENKTDIQIIKGFLSFYKTKDGLPKIKAVVQEYQVIDTKETDLPF